MRSNATAPLMSTRRAVPLAAIKDVVAQIASNFSPLKVILFGSHAAGRATTDSDVDLLVVVNRRAAPDASLNIRRRIRYGFPLDIIVCDQHRLAQRLAAGDYLMRDAVEGGVVLYERNDR